MTNEPKKPKEEDKFKDLADKYFQRFDDLNEARPVLSGVDEAFRGFAQNIWNEYKTEYEILQAEERIKAARKIYKLNLASGKLIPRTWRNWKKFFRREQNYAKTLLDEEVEQDIDRFFEECLKRLTEQKGTKREEAETDEAEEERPVNPSENAQSADAAQEDELHEVHVEEIPDLIEPPLKELVEEASEDLQDNGAEEYNDGIDKEYELIKEEGEEEFESVEPSPSAQNTEGNEETPEEAQSDEESKEEEEKSDENCEGS